MESTSKPDAALIQKIIDASAYITKHGRRGKANYMRVSEEWLESYAKEKGMTLEQADAHLRKYFKGETDVF